MAWAPDWAHRPTSVSIVGVWKKPCTSVTSGYHVLTDLAAKEVLVFSAYVKHCVKYAIKTKETPFVSLPTPSFSFLFYLHYRNICLFPASFLPFHWPPIHTKETVSVESHHWFCWRQTLHSYIFVLLTWFLCLFLAMLLSPMGNLTAATGGKRAYLSSFWKLEKAKCL